MCGRYKLTASVQELAAMLEAGIDPRLEKLPRRYNVAPTDVMPIVRVVDGRRLLMPARWGLVPFWAKDLKIGSSMINARSETLFEKPAFRESLQKRRCLVVVDGFYEWAPLGGRKVPRLIAFDDGRPFTLAGLWARWKGEPGEVETFTIVTTAANEVLSRVHDRMPVLIEDRDREEWLDPDNATVDLERLATPRPWPGVGLRAVSSRLGNVRHDDASLLVPDAEAAPVRATRAKKAPRKQPAATPKKPQGDLF
jgi:putative SOS response-associated peptidase YedK